MKQYLLKLNGREIEVKALKTQAELIVDEMKKPFKVAQYVREITGVVGGKEDTTVLMTPFTVNKIADEQGYKQDLEAFVKELPAVITTENASPIIQRAREIWRKHMPVVDRRRTPEEVTIANAEAIAMQHQRELEQEAWRTQWCKPGGPVAIPQGGMAVYLEITFNNSDPMTDYFEFHAQIGEDMLLAIVLKQAQREALARRVLGQYPELCKLGWKWHTENYSMGHGNYLLSDSFGVEKHNAYDGREEVAVCYEVRFDTYSPAMLAYKDYPGIQGAAAESAEVGEVTIRRNEELNGIEVVFPTKPDAAVLKALKALGFRWSRPQGLWYGRYSETLMKQVESLLGQDFQYSAR
jgi:hypothetical protein